MKGAPLAETKNYEITVVPKAMYVEDQSDPSKNQYVFAYTITVTKDDFEPQTVSGSAPPAVDHTIRLKKAESMKRN